MIKGLLVEGDEFFLDICRPGVFNMIVLWALHWIEWIKYLEFAFFSQDVLYFYTAFEYFEVLAISHFYELCTIIDKIETKLLNSMLTLFYS